MLRASNVSKQALRFALLAAVIALVVGVPSGRGAGDAPGPRLTTAGSILWNFEGLLNRVIGRVVAVKGANGTSPNFVTGYRVCASCRFFSFSFAAHKTTAFRLVAEGPRVPPDTSRERLVRIEGRYVLCDAKRKWFLVWYPHTLNFGLDCSPA